MKLHNFERTYQDQIPFLRGLALISFYSSVFFLIYEKNTIIAGELLIYVSLCMLVSAALIYRELRTSDINKQVIHGKFSLNNFGYELLKFDTQHLKPKEELIETKIIESLSKVVDKLDFDIKLKKVCITDNNINLIQYKQNNLHITNKQIRETSLSLIFVTRIYEDNCKLFVNWSIYLMPPITKSSIINFIATSPLFFIFRLSSIQKGIRILSRLKSIDLSYFERENVINEVTVVNQSLIDELVRMLEQHDINTDNIQLKLNEGININLGSGSLSIGNVVSGARNIISSSKRVIK